MQLYPTILTARRDEPIRVPISAEHLFSTTRLSRSSSYGKERLFRRASIPNTQEAVVGGGKGEDGRGGMSADSGDGCCMTGKREGDGRRICTDRVRNERERMTARTLSCIPKADGTISRARDEEIRRCHLIQVKQDLIRRALCILSHQVSQEQRGETNAPSC